MKLREKTNIEIYEENNVPYSILTNIIEEESTKNKIRATLQILSKVLSGSLGPYGATTTIQDREMKHFSTKDGYDILNRISFDDELSRTILDLVRNISSNQVSTVGDGSTSAIIVANALYSAITDLKTNPDFEKIAAKDIVDILNDIENFLEEKILNYAKPISADLNELKQIAMIASNNDELSGNLMHEIYSKVGKDGFITTEVLKKTEKDIYEIKKGIEWPRGYIDNIFGKEWLNKKVVYDQNIKTILFNSTLTYDDIEIILVTLLEKVFNQENVQLLIVLNNCDEDVRTFFKNNRLKHLNIGSTQPKMEFTVVDIDQITPKSIHDLKDLSVLLNCEIFDKFKHTAADVLKNPEKFIGHAEKVVVTERNTQVIAISNPSNEHKKKIEKQINELENEFKRLEEKEEDEKTDDFNKYELKRRLSNYKNSTAILYVGGKTLQERMTRERLFDDSIHACKSAIKMGTIPGGNILIPKILKEEKNELAERLTEKYTYFPLDNIKEFFKRFIEILKNTFLESYLNVLLNSYLNREDCEKIIEKCLEENLFYNLKLHCFEDLIKTSVINSVETDIQILKSCISIIGILATSNQFITLNFNVAGNIKK